MVTFICKEFWEIIYIYTHTHTYTQLIYNVVLVFGVQQSDSVIHIYILFHILLHYGLLQDTEIVPCAIQ